MLISEVGKNSVRRYANYLAWCLAHSKSSANGCYYHRYCYQSSNRRGNRELTQRAIEYSFDHV